MNSTFYRVHPSDAPEFNADNAWSAPWGTTRDADGSQYECVPCDGTGEGIHDCRRCQGSGFSDEDYSNPCTHCDDGYIHRCQWCDDGWIDCTRGYSCCDTPEELIEYFTLRGGDLVDDDDRVIVFEGYQADRGLDGEPTAVPSSVVETLTWTEFTTRYATTA